MKFKATFAVLTVLASLLFIGSQTASAAKKFRFTAANTFVFDPNNVGSGFAEWINTYGLGDFPNCRTNFGLVLQKGGSTSDPVAVGAVLEGLTGAVVTEDDTLGYDIRSDSPCVSGSPRFNVTYTLPDGGTGFSFVGGCANGTITTSPQDMNWSRVTFDLQSQAFPAIPVGSTIESVALIVDEVGSYTLDNIQFRDVYFDGSGGNRSGQPPRCSF